ncbi:glutamate-rich protein 1 [Arapaima gigas]
MASREEVFQAKVLKKLYPAAPKVREAQSAASDTGAVTKKTHIQAKAPSSKISDGAKNGTPQRKLYTVLPPPDGFRTGNEGSVVLPRSEDKNTQGDPADGNVCEPEISGQHRRRQKRAYRGPAEAAVAAQEGSVVHEEDRDTSRNISKNKKRKLKKKRQKKKLLSMGLAPGTGVVEFTYQPAGGNGEEGKEYVEDKHVQSTEDRAAELLDFLQATLEVYNRSPPTEESQEKPCILTSNAQGLLTSLSANEVPNSVLTQLHHIRFLVLQRDARKLAAALRDFQQNAALPPEEVSAVCTLFHYWITDILPTQSNMEPSEQVARRPGRSCVT